VYEGGERLREAGVKEAASAQQRGHVADQPHQDRSAEKEPDEDSEEEVLG
jgi:hypothetical protein